MQFRLYIAAADGIMHARCDHVGQFRYRLSGLRNLIGRLADTWDACIVNTLLAGSPKPPKSHFDVS